MGMSAIESMSELHKSDVEHDSSDVVWVGQPKQREFLESESEELLFGGAAGGSKTESLLVFAAGHIPNKDGFIPNTSPNFASLVLRRTYPELEELIMRAKVLYKKLIPGIKFSGGKNIFWIPEGGFILFGQCERDVSVEKYLGREYAHISIDELGLFKTNYVWTMLKARNRCKDSRIKCKMRGTCNPGPRWLIDYFPVGEGDKRQTDCRIINEHATTYEYLPSRLADNKYLGDDYRAKLEALPDDLREAFLNGKWNCYAIKGAIYEDEYRAWQNNNAITFTPFVPGYPIEVALDRGHNDACAIIYAQLIGNRINVIQSVEGTKWTAYKAVDEVRRYLDTQHGSLGNIYLPHDAANQNFEATDSTKGIFETAFPGHIPALLTREDPQVRIDRVRHQAPRVAFDATNCETVLTALRQYHRDYNSRLNMFTTPCHDENSHSADAFGYLIQGVVDNTWVDTSQYRKLISPGW